MPASPTSQYETAGSGLQPSQKKLDQRAVLRIVAGAAVSGSSSRPAARLGKIVELVMTAGPSSLRMPTPSLKLMLQLLMTVPEAASHTPPQELMSMRHNRST